MRSPLELTLTTSHLDRGVLRPLLERTDLTRVCRHLADALTGTPGYEPCGSFLVTGENMPFMRWNLGLFFRWLRSGVPPATSELGELERTIQAKAARGVRLQDGLLVYNRATQLVWAFLLDAATEQERAVLVSYSDLMLKYQGILLETFTRAYDVDDAAQPVSERRASILLEALRSPGALTTEEYALADAMGFLVAESYHPFIAKISGGSDSDHVGLAGRLRAAGALAATKARWVEGLAMGAFGWEPHLAEERIVLATDRLTPRHQLQSAFADLHVLLAVAADTGRSGRLDVDDYLAQVLLYQSPRLADRITQLVYGSLADQNGDGLALTLQTLVANRFDRTSTAAALPLHRNTLLYRLNRIREITGLDFRDPQAIALAWLASQWKPAKRLRGQDIP